MAIDEDSLFGISIDDKCKLFSCDGVSAYANFYYDGVNGSERSIRLWILDRYGAVQKKSP